MAILVADCPHCLATRSAMTVFGVKSVPVEQGTFVKHDEYKQSLYRWKQAIAAACQVCFKPVCAVVTTPYEHRRSEFDTINTKVSKALLGEGNVISLGFKLAEMWPVQAASAIPDHLPETVAKAFRSAEANYQLEDGEDAAAMLYRRAIDVAIREKHPEIKGLLAPRISELVKRALLPPSMKEWADQIRLIGNDGAHEPEGVKRDDLVPMRGFTEAFLRYFITIPFEVAIRRGEIDAEGNPIAEPEPI